MIDIRSPYTPDAEAVLCCYTDGVTFIVISDRGCVIDFHDGAVSSGVDVCQAV